MKRGHNVLQKKGLVFFFSGALLLPLKTWGATPQGLVSMRGSIIEAPCDIAVGDRVQSIRMGTIPLERLISQGRGPEQKVAIRLVNCSLWRADTEKPNWQRFTVTFDGERAGEYFGVSGRARGVALLILDQQGKPVIPGTPMPATAINATEMQLDYSIVLVANQGTPRVGDYRSSIRFKIDYY